MPNDKNQALLLAVAACHVSASSLQLAELCHPAHLLITEVAPFLISMVTHWALASLGSVALLIELARIRSYLAAECASVQALALGLKWWCLFEQIQAQRYVDASGLTNPSVQVVIFSFALFASLVALAHEWKPRR